MPDEYYTHQFSGEEIDDAVVAARQLLENAVMKTPTLLTSADDINAWHGNGYYRWSSPSVPQNAPTLLRSDETGMYMYEFGYTEGFTQICGCAVASSPGLIQRQVFYGVPLQFGEWEWVDPPLQSGVEYRTTKRVNGKPVFTRSISFNGLDASGNKVIFLGTDEAKAAWIVSAVVTDPDDTASDGNFISIPHHSTITIGILGRWISIKWTGDYSKYTDGTIVVEYIKEAI